MVSKNIKQCTITESSLYPKVTLKPLQTMTDPLSPHLSIFLSSPILPPWEIFISLHLTQSTATIYLPLSCGCSSWPPMASQKDEQQSGNFPFRLLAYHWGSPLPTAYLASLPAREIPWGWVESSLPVSMQQQPSNNSTCTKLLPFLNMLIVSCGPHQNPWRLL